MCEKYVRRRVAGASRAEDSESPDMSPEMGTRPQAEGFHVYVYARRRIADASKASRLRQKIKNT
eukprot:CAMPEP_0205903076 /NCGR_PEP_ID=MMETSP1083-20121108/28547_1 /ASSEMBLY_ACC=CAM_ASM_000430 /TAXON_ID=97485 /ORGANISM="Prymnesium parvum, Strain Texoma1" /LENGTH=63 /DNA_ID=CAMNT_0053268697 /DNA_START=151 /DNA_END=345 /DNA_ORIENTATION=-